MTDDARTPRERLLDPLDRSFEVLFGLIMAVTFIGSISVATAGRNEVRTVLYAALGCNLAWGLVDAVMFLLRTLTENQRMRTLALRVRSADEAEGRRLIEQALPGHLAPIAGPNEVEGMRRKVLALRPIEAHGLGRRDYLAALGIFLLVVLATFPVALPFLLTPDLALAMQISRAVTLAMLFLAGSALGRYAGHPHPIRTGLLMMLFGAVLILVVIALGG